MILSTASGYAARALAYLARHEGAGLVKAEVIADAESLSVAYLRKLMTQLAAAGVLRTSKGREGGYALARPAKAVSLLDVVEAIDGPVRGRVPRWAPGLPLDERLQEVCDAAAQVTRRRLRKVTLADLADGKG
jgi:Rrf2 family protein